MRQWIRSALVQIVARRLFGAKPLSKPMLSYCQLEPWEQTSMKLSSKYKTFIRENAYQITVPEMSAIVSKGWWVNDKMNPQPS